MYPVTHMNQPQVFTDVGLRYSRSDGSSSGCKPGHIVEVSTNGQTCVFRILEGSGNVTIQSVLSKQTEGCRLGRLCFAISLDPQSIILVFPNLKDFQNFERLFKSVTGKGETTTKSIFDDRTEESSAVQYFQFYGYLSQQQNMMQDYIRTSTYQRAFLQNVNDFRDKIVLDVGAGTGILSFFAVQAGARKVYAVEASSMASHAERLVEHNNTCGIVEVITGKIEEIDLPEQIDVIISEPMGYMLFNERMIETYLHAKKWLKPNGKMFPTRGDLYIAPFTDDALYMEHYGKSNFWCQSSFYGIDLTSIRHEAVQEYFKQPIVDTFDVRILMAKPCCHGVNFLTTKEEDLHKIHIPLQYTMLMTGTLHGLAFWFDVGFLGSTAPIWLSTAPQEPLTHWYQVRCLFPNPVFVRAGQKVSGNVVLHANQRQSYDVEMDISVDGTGVKSSNILDLKNPFFRYTGIQTQPPPGTQSGSPTESYWNNSNVVLNGGSVLTSGALVSGHGGLSSGSYQLGYFKEDNQRNAYNYQECPQNCPSQKVVASSHISHKQLGM